MKIGIDARMYRSSVAGISRYSQNLIKNLLEIDHEDEFVLFMTKEDEEEFKIQNAKSCLPKGKITNQNIKIIRTDIKHYSIAEQTKLNKIIERENLDLMHFVNFNYPVRYKGKFIVTIHDLTLLFYPGTAKKTYFLKKWAYRYVFQKACQNSEKIIAVSENTKKDLIKIFKVEPSCINVIYEAADDKIFSSSNQSEKEKIINKYKIDKPVILYVGQFRPHKNIPGLIRAFDLLSENLDCKLVILGKPDLKHKQVWEWVDKSTKKRDIIMPGFVSNVELAAWYKIATVFCFPSFYEGFGLPGLEAMQAGSAVVASKCSSLPEIYKEAALYFDPFNPNDIADKIKAVITNPKLRADLIRKGREVSRNYSWKKNAVETLKIYKEISNF